MNLQAEIKKLIDSGEIVWNDKFGYTGDITIYSNDKTVYLTFSRETLPRDTVIVQGISFESSYRIILVGGPGEIIL